MRFLPSIAIVLSAIATACVVFYAPMPRLAWVEGVTIPGWYAIMAAWAVRAGLSRRPLVERIAVFLAAPLAYTGTYWLLDGTPIDMEMRELPDGFLVLGVLPTIVFAVLTLCRALVVRHGGGDPSDENPLVRWPMQFSLRTLLVAMMAIATVFGGRTFYESHSDGWVLNEELFDVQVGAALVALCVTWLVFGSRYALARVATCGLAVVAATGWLWWFGWAHVWEWAIVFAVILSTILLPFRLLGYRLARRG